jgi:hypothetical protein
MLARRQFDVPDAPTTCKTHAPQPLTSHRPAAAGIIV